MNQGHNPIANTRACLSCGKPLFESFGLVKAGDFLRFIEAKQKNSDDVKTIRETCFKCSVEQMGSSFTD